LATLYVARSKALSDWGYDVGLSKHIYKIGLTDRPVKELIAAGWAGLPGWVLVRRQDDVTGVTEDEIIERLARKEKLLDPKLYPRIRETPGIFKVNPTHVENHLLVTRALADQPELKAVKIAHPEIAAYLMLNGLPMAPA
jgi:hypothetical protein